MRYPLGRWNIAATVTQSILLELDVTFPVVESESFFEFLQHGFIVFFNQKMTSHSTEWIEIQLARTLTVITIHFIPSYWSTCIDQSKVFSCSFLIKINGFNLNKTGKTQVKECWTREVELCTILGLFLEESFELFIIEIVAHDGDEDGADFFRFNLAALGRIEHFEDPPQHCGNATRNQNKKEKPAISIFISGVKGHRRFVLSSCSSSSGSPTAFAIAHKSPANCNQIKSTEMSWIQCSIKCCYLWFHTDVDDVGEQLTQRPGLDGTKK